MDFCDRANHQSVSHDILCVQHHSQHYEALKNKVIVTGPNDKRYCEDCDCEIPDKRIKAVPYATRCVKCQEAFENPKKNY